MNRLYFAPGSCALGIHVLLEEIGAPYQGVPISLRDGEQMGAAFRAINPKGKVPTLVRADGSALTEWGTIATWLALSHAGAGLLPADVEGRIRVQEFIEHVVGTIHMRGFTLVARAGKFSDDPGAQGDIRKAGAAIMQDGFAFLDAALGDKSWLFGDFSIADAAVFYLTFWAIAGGYDMPGSLRDFHARMLARPAVQRALAAQGL